MKKWFWGCLVALVLLPTTAAQSTPLQVVTTTTIMADVAQKVGGEFAQVTALVPADSDVHAFVPTPADIARVAEADLVLVNGAGLESFLGDLLANAAGVELTVISTGIPAIAMGGAADEHEHGAAHEPTAMPTMASMEHGEHNHSSVTTAAYFTINNSGSADDTLVSVGINPDIAAMTEMHESIVENDIARMQPLTDGVVVPAGGSVSFEPGGKHVMVMGVLHTLDASHEPIELTLTFASGTVITITATVQDLPPSPEASNMATQGDLTVVGAWLRPVAAAENIHDHGEPAAQLPTAGEMPQVAMYAGVNYAGVYGTETDCGGLLAEHEHEAEGDDHDHEHGICDPHFWTDPINVTVWVDNIAAALAQADPAHADAYLANAEAYKTELFVLDLEITQILSAIPAEQRVLVTNHEFLAYFAARYGFEIVGTVIPGGSTLTETDPQELAALVTTINDENVAAIFVEASEPGKLAQVVAEEVGRPIQVITLYSDSLSATGGEADSYVKYLRYNARAIVQGIMGQ